MPFPSPQSFPHENPLLKAEAQLRAIWGFRVLPCAPIQHLRASFHGESSRVKKNKSALKCGLCLESAEENKYGQGLCWWKSILNMELLYDIMFLPLPNSHNWLLVTQIIFIRNTHTPIHQYANTFSCFIGNLRGKMTITHT